MKSTKRLSSAIFVCLSLSLSSAYGQESPKLSDAEVPSVAVVANQIELGYTEVAKEKSKNRKY